jgi:hypothetical protein
MVLGFGLARALVRQPDRELRYSSLRRLLMSLLVPVATLVAAAVGLPAIASWFKRQKSEDVGQTRIEIDGNVLSGSLPEKQAREVGDQTQEPIATEGRGATIKFGSQHDESKATIDIKPKGDARRLPKPSPRVPPKVTSSSLDYRVLMQILLSVLLVCASLYVVLAAHYDPNSKHWAFGTLGTIMGFWLRGVR